MVEKPEQGTNWESFIKMLLIKLDIPTKEDLVFLNSRLDRLEQLLNQKKTGKPVQAKPAESRKSASSIVLEVIGNHPKGADFKIIQTATGFNEKKLRNIIFRLDKIKKIKRVKRGSYQKIERN
ncbi:MAG: hypothetical protein A2277_04880 [Desulfobacterales bacterium RIFOXYA12_FULL_46_15]|nr:MAG: hypothetical protein A2097_05710 [Desulfobacula sp. GWF2_41_7]OGR25342.1 MAG: hypothetical protein A2277_04880 [Desulfobacterales bacterium RIFOXYA12_FULL_46_15]